MVQARDVWQQYSVTGEGVKVCVLNTGILATHSDFEDTIIDGYDGGLAITPWNKDANGHGTHVSGTIAAADNNIGVVGVAPGTVIYTVRVFDDTGSYYGSDIVAAAQACRDYGVNISLWESSTEGLLSVKF